MMESKTIASRIEKQYDLNCFDLISRAADLFSAREDFAYMYGAKGQVLTDATIRALMAAEPIYYKRYSDEELQEIYNFSIGKIGIDCSGFINLLTGQTNWSTGYFMESLNKTDPVKGTWGNLLYTTFGGTGRHIGIDIGEGRFLHCSKEMHTIEMGMVKDYPWEYSGQFKGVSYFLTGDR